MVEDLPRDGLISKSDRRNSRIHNRSITHVTPLISQSSYSTSVCIPASRITLSEEFFDVADFQPQSITSMPASALAASTSIYGLFSSQHLTSIVIPVSELSAPTVPSYSFANVA
jgi:hypothetical protein